MDERWAFLRPWCAPVAGRLELEFRDWTVDVERRCVGLSVSLASAGKAETRATLRAVHDALVLLALVARADTCAWRHVLLKHCRLRLSEEEAIAVDADAFDEPRFVIKLSRGECADVRMLEGLLFPDARPAGKARGLSVAIRQVVDRSIGGRLGATGELVDIPVAVYVDTPVYEPSILVQVWSSLLGIKERCGGWRVPVEFPEGAPAIACAIVVGPLGVKSTGKELEGEPARVVGDMVTRSGGLGISELVLSIGNDDDYSYSYMEEDDNGEEEVLKTGRLLERMLCAGGCSTEDRSAVEEINLFCALNDASGFARVCSAVAETQTAESLVLRFYPISEDFTDYVDQIQRAWRYLAYALFSSHARARSSVTSVVLDGLEMFEEHANDIAEVLAFTDPASELFAAIGYEEDDDGTTHAAGDDNTERPAVVGMLKEGTAVTLMPMKAGDEMAQWDLATDVHGVRVLREYQRSERAIVLVPGYGVCMVPRFQVVPGADTRESGGVTSLHMQFNKPSDDVGGLPRFLELIGPSLARLSLDLPSGADIWTADMLSSCPNLKVFVLKGPASIDTEAFLTVYAENDLQIEELDCPFDDIARLARELADTRTLIAKRLKRLAFRFGFELRSADDGVQLDDIVRMLKANRILEYLHVALPSGVLCNVLHIEEVKAAHNQPLPAMDERLSTDCRLAFISIFHSRRSASQEQDAKRAGSRKAEASPPARLDAVLGSFPIDHNVLSHIFDFAARCVHRRSYLTVYSELEW